LSINFNEHKSLQKEVVVYMQNIKSLKAEIDGHREYVNSLNISFKEKEKKYEDEVRVLKRKINEAEFET
jgi:predicted  nucleic acid-binding Zn-ribbon protein